MNIYSEIKSNVQSFILLGEGVTSTVKQNDIQHISTLFEKSGQILILQGISPADGRRSDSLVKSYSLIQFLLKLVTKFAFTLLPLPVGQCLVVKSLEV